jgi:hypothetical protein
VSLLTKIVKGRQQRAVRLMVHGFAGCGKSTFAAGAPNPLFIDAEKRTGHLDVARIEPATWPEVLAIMGEVIQTKPCQTLVFDTLDYMEAMVWEYLCKREGASSIEKVAGGWGKGYNVARDEFQTFMMGVDKLTSMGINCIMLAHSELRTYKNPVGDDYEQYAIKLHKAAKAMITSKVDVVGFACFEDFAKSKDGKSKAKASTTGDRVLKFEHHPAWESKAGIPLPDQCGLSWAEFSKALTP